MPTSQNQLLRELRVAFSAAELELLQGIEQFVAAMNGLDGSPDRVQRLIELGGGLLAEHNRSKSKLRDSRDHRT